MSTNPEGRERPRIRSTGYDAALVRAVRAEQREPGPVMPGLSTAHLGHLMATRESTSGSSRRLRQRAGRGARSATPRLAHRAIPACTWAPGALRCALFRVPYVRGSPREVPHIRGFTRGLAHFEACPVVSRWGILALRPTFTRTGDHDTSTALRQAKLSCRWQSRTCSGVGRTNPSGWVRRDGRALPRRWPMNTGHGHGMGPKGTHEHALGLNDCERSHAFPNMARGRKGGKS